LNDLKRIYRLLSAGLLLAFMANLFLPAGAGAMRLQCQKNHAKNSSVEHTSMDCCRALNHITETIQTHHNDCLYPRLCKQSFTNEASRLQVVPTSNQQPAFVSATQNQSNLLCKRNRKLLLAGEIPELPPTSIFLLNSCFLN